MVGQALLGLLAHAISRGNLHRVDQSAPILLVLFTPLYGGALILVLALGLAFVPDSVEDCSDRVLARGMVCGDVEQVAGGLGL